MKKISYSIVALAGALFFGLGAQQAAMAGPAISGMKTTVGVNHFDEASTTARASGTRKSSFIGVSKPKDSAMTKSAMSSTKKTPILGPKKTTQIEMNSAKQDYKKGDTPPNVNPGSKHETTAPIN